MVVRQKKFFWGLELKVVCTHSRSPGSVKRRHMILHPYGNSERFPLRRSKREKRLLFATFNVSEMDKQIRQNYPLTSEVRLMGSLYNNESVMWAVYAVRYPMLF